MFRSAVVAMSLCVSGVAFGSSHESGHEEASYDTLDKNSDGKVDREESKAHAKMSEAHDQIDTDKSGDISRAEYEVWRKEKSHDHDDNSRFVALDTNKDRNIDKTEAADHADVMPKFSNADVDANGMISEEEWMNWRREGEEHQEAKESGEEAPSDSKSKGKGKKKKA